MDKMLLQRKSENLIIFAKNLTNYIHYYIIYDRVIIFIVFIINVILNFKKDKKNINILKFSMMFKKIVVHTIQKLKKILFVFSKPNKFIRTTI